MISADQPAIPDKKHLDNRILIPEVFTVIHGYCNDVPVLLPVAGDLLPFPDLPDTADQVRYSIAPRSASSEAFCIFSISSLMAS